MNKFELRIAELEYQNSQLQANFEKVLQLNEQLRKEIQIRDKRIAELELKVSKLEAELEKYKVKPNEPSGSKPYFEKYLKNKLPAKKSGQKKGHAGESRMSPKDIHKFVEYKPTCCQICGSNKLKNLKIRSKIITDLEFKVVNSKEYYFDMKCQNCGSKTKPQSMHGTSNSPFGRNFQTLLSYLRSVCGDTLRPMENLFRDFFKLEVSDSTISNTEIRISKETLNEYNKYLDLVKQADFSHKDETSYRINGINNWIWVYDSCDYVFYRIADSRGMKVVEKDFGLEPKQISINDCYAAYNRFEKQQICWAHLIREAKGHSLKENASKYEKQFSKQLNELYRKACEFSNGDPPIEKRAEMRAHFENKLVKLMLTLKVKSNFLKRICKRLNERLIHCFLFVEIEGLPSTNNQAERSLRPFVCHRKVSQGSKSFAGAQAKVILKTQYENDKRKGLQLSDSLNHIFKIQKFVNIQTT